MLGFLGFKSKPKITEKMLEQYNINIIKYADIKIDKTPIATTGSGIFYKGTYQNEAVSIKVVDITKDATVINEFLFWDLYKDNKNFLQLQGAAINGSDAYLVFDFFAFTLETALKQHLVTEDNRTNLVKQCSYIVSTLQMEGKKTTDIRPGIFGITDNVVVKFLDFGILVNSDRLFNNDIILKDRIKYQPPEYFNFQGDDLNYDIWSFGCLLIDVYSTEKPIYTQNLTQNEISKKIVKGEYPEIPNDVSPLLKNILMRCFEKDYTKRIKVEEFLSNMTVFFENEDAANENGNIADKKHQFDFDEENRLETCYQFAKQIDNAISETSNLVNNKYMDDVDDMINVVKEYQEMSTKKLNENYAMVKECLQKIYDFNIDVISKFKERTTNKLLIMKQYYTYALTEISKTKKMSDEIKRGINSISKMKNIDSYNKIIETYEKSVEDIKINIQKFSEEAPYDKIFKLYSDNNSMLDMFKYVAMSNIITMQNVVNLIKDHNDIFQSDENVKGLSLKLGIEDDILEKNEIKNEPLNKNRINELYVKAQDNSNIIVIFNMYSKQIFHIKLPSVKFNLKSYSFYDRATQTAYITGGLSEPSNKFSYDNSMYRLTVTLVKGEYQFDMKSLTPMLDNHTSHAMTKYTEKYLIVVGGSNTQTCEFYSIGQNEWKLLPEIPSFVTNPAICIFNCWLYVLSGSVSYDVMYRLKLANLDKYIQAISKENNEQEIQSLMTWENINYYITEGKLQKGMGICPVSNKIYVFGGFDASYMFDDIYTITFKDLGFFKDIGQRVKEQGSSLKDKIKDKLLGKKKEEDNTVNNNEEEIITLVKSRELLPNKTYFSSNIVAIENTLIMLDGMNNAYEYNIGTKEFFYYT